MAAKNWRVNFRITAFASTEIEAESAEEADEMALAWVKEHATAEELDGLGDLSFEFFEVEDETVEVDPLTGSEV